MTEYRIGERDRRFWIEVKSNKVWVSLNQTGVPRYFDSLADARSWVLTIKRGVVYHDAEEQKEHLCEFNRALNGDCLICGSNDAPNLAQDERKAEDDTFDGIKPLEWFLERVGQNIENRIGYLVPIFTDDMARSLYNCQLSGYYDRYSDPS